MCFQIANVPAYEPQIFHIQCVPLTDKWPGFYGCHEQNTIRKRIPYRVVIGINPLRNHLGIMVLTWFQVMSNTRLSFEVQQFKVNPMILLATRCLMDIIGAKG